VLDDFDHGGCIEAAKPLVPIHERTSGDKRQWNVHEFSPTFAAPR
jgi:hypothetical protein